jgi:hypothetical protein
LQAKIYELEKQIAQAQTDNDATALAKATAEQKELLAKAQ